MASGMIVVLAIMILIGLMEAGNVKQMEQVDDGKYIKPEPRKFSASNCSMPIANRLVYFEELNLSPNPIVFDQFERVTVGLQILQDLGTNLEGSLEVFMMMDGEWTDFCPLLGDKTCHLKDFCSTIKGHHACSSALDLCSCPIHKNRYYLDLPIKLPSMSMGIEGTFNVTLTLKQNEEPIGCVNTVFCLNRCS